MPGWEPCECQKYNLLIEKNKKVFQDRKKEALDAKAAHKTAEMLSHLRQIKKLKQDAWRLAMKGCSDLRKEAAKKATKMGGGRRRSRRRSRRRTRRRTRRRRRRRRRRRSRRRGARRRRRGGDPDQHLRQRVVVAARSRRRPTRAGRQAFLLGTGAIGTGGRVADLARRREAQAKAKAKAAAEAKSQAAAVAAGAAVQPGG